MELVIKTFSELTTEELYRILQARAEVFVVEQNCVYQDLDGLDEGSLHLWYEDQGRITAYLRMFPKKGAADTVHIGRVLTIDRGVGLGGKLLCESLIAAREKMNAEQVYLEAQVYATGFYEKVGFKVVSEEFLEDGIPHVQMIRKF